MFKKIIFGILIIVLSVAGGALFFLVEAGYLVVMWQGNPINVGASSRAPSGVQRVVFFYPSGNGDAEGLFSTTLELQLTTLSPSERLTHVITQWLYLLKDEGIVHNHVTLRSASFSGDETHLFLLFNNSFINPMWSVRKKLECIQSLLKTIQGVVPKVRWVSFFAHDCFLEDDHLDLSRTWPITGYDQ